MTSPRRNARPSCAAPADSGRATRHRPPCRCTDGPRQRSQRRTSHRRSRPRSAPRPRRPGNRPPMLRRRPPGAGRPRPRGTAGAAAGAARDARPPRRSSSSCDRPVPSAARPPSGRSTAGSPAGESTRPPVPAGPLAARTGRHRLPWQQRLPRLGRVSQTHHDRGSRTYAATHLTCANNPTVTNYCCRTCWREHSPGAITLG
jgi:hypothetical protein